MKTSTTAPAKASKAAACVWLPSPTGRSPSSRRTGLCSGTWELLARAAWLHCRRIPGFHAALPCSGAPEAAGFRRSLRAQLCCFRGGHAWRGPVQETPAARLQHRDGLKPPPAVTTPAEPVFTNRCLNPPRGAALPGPAHPWLWPWLCCCCPPAPKATPWPRPCPRPVLPSKWASLLGAKALSSQIPQALCKNTVQNRGLL